METIIGKKPLAILPLIDKKVRTNDFSEAVEKFVSELKK
jgi:hypothetical protein